MTLAHNPIVRTAILAAGIAVGGLLAGNGFARARASDRYVTVKGVSERNVRADQAIWLVHVQAGDNDLAQAHALLQNSALKVRQFLERHGVDTAGISLQSFAVTDALANQYASGPVRGNRYVIRQTLVVRSNKPEVVLAASQKVAELASAGVVLSGGEEYGAPKGPTFVYSGLNSIKPQMIAEATARAREGAEQFARDSRSPLGGIRQANQGVFSILPRDQVPGISEESQIEKTVRVVSTVEYFLRN